VVLVICKPQLLLAAVVLVGLLEPQTLVVVAVATQETAALAL
jgi:hypothetical protein